MEQPKSTQNLEHRVEVLEERMDNAIRGETTNALIALGTGAVGGFLLYVGFSYDLYTAKEISGVVRSISMVALGGLASAVSLISAAKSALDYHRGNSLADRIEEIKQSPEYKALEGSKQDN